jgi:hypothetical protein
LNYEHSRLHQSRFLRKTGFFYIHEGLRIAIYLRPLYSEKGSLNREEGSRGIRGTKSGGDKGDREGERSQN